MNAYLDIETSMYQQITVIGIYYDNKKFVQLVGCDITSEKLLKALKDVKKVYTFNGNRFDLPYIKKKLGVDVFSMCEPVDLMHDCHRHNLKGGLKAVEKILGIKRKLPDMNGYDAVLLWEDYVNTDNAESLNKLLAYNKEDVVNLKELKKKIKKLKNTLKTGQETNNG